MDDPERSKRKIPETYIPETYYDLLAYYGEKELVNIEDDLDRDLENLCVMHKGNGDKIESIRNHYKMYIKDKRLRSSNPRVFNLTFGGGMEVEEVKEGEESKYSHIVEGGSSETTRVHSEDLIDVEVVKESKNASYGGEEKLKNLILKGQGLKGLYSETNYIHMRREFLAEIKEALNMTSSNFGYM